MDKMKMGAEWREREKRENGERKVVEGGVDKMKVGAERRERERKEEKWREGGWRQALGGFTCMSSFFR